MAGELVCIILEMIELSSYNIGTVTWFYNIVPTQSKTYLSDFSSSATKYQFLRSNLILQQQQNAVKEIEQSRFK